MCLLYKDKNLGGGVQFTLSDKEKRADIWHGFNSHHSVGSNRKHHYYALRSVVVVPQCDGIQY